MIFVFKFKQYAKKEIISETKIHAVRCLYFLSVENLKNSFTVNQKVREFLEFEKLNDSIFIFIDKSPNLCYRTNADYEKKLGELFLNEKF